MNHPEDSVTHEWAGMKVARVPKTRILCRIICIVNTGADYLQYVLCIMYIVQAACLKYKIQSSLLMVVDL